MHTSMISEEGEEEASGTLGLVYSNGNCILPEHWIRPSASPVRLVDLAESESPGFSPQLNYTYTVSRDR